MTTYDRHGGRDDLGEAIFAVDPDIALISDYLARELSPAAADAVEDRLRTDFDFYMKVGPIVKAWTMPVSYRALLAQGEPARATAEAPAPPQKDMLPPPRRVREPQATYAPFAEKTEASFPVAHDVAVHAARTARRTHFLERATTVLIYAVAASFVLTGPIYLVRQIAAEHKSAVDVSQGRVPTGNLRLGQQVEAPGGETRAILLPQGSRVLLRPGARATHQSSPKAGTRVLLDGEAAFDVTKADRFVDVRTSAGHVLLMPGSYAVRCDPGCAVMLVTVGVGMANLRGDTSTVGMTLRNGEYGRVPRGGNPEKVDGNVDGFPLPESAPRAPDPAAPAKSGSR